MKVMDIFTRACGDAFSGLFQLLCLAAFGARKTLCFCSHGKKGGEISKVLVGSMPRSLLVFNLVSFWRLAGLCGRFRVGAGEAGMRQGRGG